MKKWKCTICGWTYDELKAVPKTAFLPIPDGRISWKISLP